jgi:Protein of unknown function (DUF2971)
MVSPKVAMQVLYHYCSTAAFHSIISSKTLRLSSVRQSNDHTEGRLVAEAIRRLALNEGLGAEELAQLQNLAKELEDDFEGLAFCLSQNGDQLSQWRGYAENGSGVAIGFSRAYLDGAVDSSVDSSLELALYQAKYDQQEHDVAIQPLYSHLKAFLGTPQQVVAESDRLRELRNREAGLRRVLSMMEAFDHVFALKHSAFAEEQEWRLLHHFSWSAESPCSYHPSPGRLVPFIYSEPLDVTQSPILEVVLGPRHTSQPESIGNFLLQSGFPGIVVKPSYAPYR